MTWRIPPVGWCAYCLRDPDPDNPGERNEVAAHTIYNGTSICYDHLVRLPRDPRLKAGYP